MTKEKRPSGKDHNGDKTEARQVRSGEILKKFINECNFESSSGAGI